MDAGDTARERSDPSTHPAAADARVTCSSADDPPIPTVGADARAPPRGGAAPTTNTIELEAGATFNGVSRVETGDEPATMVLMRVKEELALVNMGVDSGGFVNESEQVRNVEGGIEINKVCFGEKEGTVPADMGTSAVHVKLAVGGNVDDHVYVGEGTVEVPRLSCSGQESFAVGGAVDWGLQGCAHPDTVGAKGGDLSEIAGGKMVRRNAGGQRLRADLEATASFPSIYGPSENLAPSVAGDVGASGGTGGRFAVWRDEDVVEGARSDQGGGESGNGVNDNDDVFANYEEVDEEYGFEAIDVVSAVANVRPRISKDRDDDDVEFIDTNEVGADKVESGESMEDSIWTKLCSDIRSKPPNMSIDELNTIYKNGVLRRGIEEVFWWRVVETQELRGNDQAERKWT